MIEPRTSHGLIQFQIPTAWNFDDRCRFSLRLGFCFILLKCLWRLAPDSNFGWNTKHKFFFSAYWEERGIICAAMLAYFAIIFNSWAAIKLLLFDDFSFFGAALMRGGENYFFFLFPQSSKSFASFMCEIEARKNTYAPTWSTAWLFRSFFLAFVPIKSKRRRAVHLGILDMQCQKSSLVCFG